MADDPRSGETVGGWRGVTVVMPGALSPLALPDLRHPLRIPPILLREVALTRVVLPAWAGGRLDTATVTIAFECLPIAPVVAIGSGASSPCGPARPC